MLGGGATCGYEIVGARLETREDELLDGTVRVQLDRREDFDDGVIDVDTVECEEAVPDPCAGLTHAKGPRALGAEMARCR